jgi:site-specific recombinase XerD
MTHRTVRERNNAELARDWIAHLASRRLGGNTLYTYESTLGALVRFSGKRSVCTLSASDLSGFLARPRQGRAKGQSGRAATLAREASILRGFYSWLVGLGLVQSDPTGALVPARVANVLPKAIDDRVWLQLWQSDLADDARVVLGLGYMVGLRRAEIVALAPWQVDLANRRLVRFRRKGGGDDQTPFGAILDVLAARLPHVLGDGAETLTDPLSRLCSARAGARTLLPWDDVDASMIARRRHALAGGQIDPQRVNVRLRTWLRRAGLPEQSLTPHCLRHSAVTNLLRSGVPIALVSRLVNHSNITTTMRYAKLGEDELGEWLRTNRHP